uniref:Uncharacterized protein n=1 Tax=Zea mays TaxID=4577 RepID=C4J9V5_MAIZE|nr:unknown [Zea mays]
MASQAMPSSLRTHGACMCIPDEKHQRNNSLRRSRDAEGGGGLLDALPGALEPPLVAGLRLADVELAVGDGGGDELVLAALVAVRRPGQHGDAVVLLAVHHGGGALQHVGGGHGVGLEPALGVGLAAVGLLAEQVVDLREELLGGAVLGDGLLGGGLDDDGHVAVGVEVVLVAEHLPGELPLLAGVPLGRDQQLEAVADVGDEVRVLLGLAEHVGCFPVGGGGGARLGADGRDAGEERERGAARHVALRRGGLLLLGLADEQLRAARRGGEARRRRGHAGGGLVEEARGGRHGSQLPKPLAFLASAA